MLPGVSLTSKPPRPAMAKAWRKALRTRLASAEPMPPPSLAHQVRAEQPQLLGNAQPIALDQPIRAADRFQIKLRHPAKVISTEPALVGIRIGPLEQIEQRMSRDLFDARISRDKRCDGGVVL